MKNVPDTEMTEADSSASPPPPPAPHMAESSSALEDSVKSVLTIARQLINQGKPSQALQAVVTAMRMKGGEDAVIYALNRAQELYRRKIQESAAADELASLFAECAIAEAMPSESDSSDHSMVQQSVDVDIHKTSILAELGRKQVVLDAYADGSSFVCLQCGGLVSNHRKEEHFTFWCCKI